MRAGDWLAATSPAARVDRLSVAESIAHIRTGTWPRILFTALCVVTALPFGPRLFLGALLLFLIAWELLMRPFADRWVATARDERTGYRRLAALNFVGACAYCTLPALVWSSGEIAGALLAVAWVCATAAHLFVYFSGARVLLLANLTPVVAVAIAAPFSGATALSALSLVGAALLMGLVMLGGVAGYDRKALVMALTQSAAAKRAAEETAIARSRFLGLASHELRTPLNAIIGYAELIGEAKDEHAGDAARILTAAHRLLSIVDEMLEVSKLEGGLAVLDRTAAPAITLVELLVERGAALAAVNANRFDVHVEGILGEARLDWPRLGRAAMHLVDNAAKFTKGGSIDVTVSRDGPDLVVRVRDTGAGIAADRLADIFAPLAQADASSTRRHEGAGLGLAYARLVARLMGGDVTCESRLGAGSTFTLRVRTE